MKKEFKKPYLLLGICSVQISMIFVDSLLKFVRIIAAKMGYVQEEYVTAMLAFLEKIVAKLLVGVMNFMMIQQKNVN